MTIGSNDPLSVTVTKEDTYATIAAAIETAVDAASNGAAGATSDSDVTISRLFSAGDISVDVNGPTVTTTIEGGETAAQVATAINTKIAAESFTDVTNTDNGDGTVT